MPVTYIKQDDDVSIAYPFMNDIKHRCYEIIEEKFRKYGNSWAENKNLDKDFWFLRLLGELQEWHKASNQEDAKKEALDIINIASMIYTLETVRGIKRRNTYNE